MGICNVCLVRTYQRPKKRTEIHQEIVLLTNPGPSYSWSSAEGENQRGSEGGRGVGLELRRGLEKRGKGERETLLSHVDCPPSPFSSFPSLTPQLLSLAAAAVQLGIGHSLSTVRLVERLCPPSAPLPPLPTNTSFPPDPCRPERLAVCVGPAGRSR